MAYDFQYVKQNIGAFFKEDRFNRNILETVRSVNSCNPRIEGEQTIYSVDTNNELAGPIAHLRNYFSKQYSRAPHRMTDQQIIFTNIRVLMKYFDHFDEGNEFYIVEKIPYEDIAEIQGESLVFKVVLKSGKVVVGPWPIDGNALVQKAYPFIKYSELRNER